MAAFDTPLTSTYEAFLLSPTAMSQQPAQDPTSGPPLPPPVSLHDLMNIPAPVTRLLVDLAPFLAYTRRAAEILNWSSSRTADSWLVLAVWWALCLVTDFSVR